MKAFRVHDTEVCSFNFLTPPPPPSFPNLPPKIYSDAIPTLEALLNLAFIWATVSLLWYLLMLLRQHSAPDGADAEEAAVEVNATPELVAVLKDMVASHERFADRLDRLDGGSTEWPTQSAAPPAPTAAAPASTASFP